MVRSPEFSWDAEYADSILCAFSVCDCGYSNVHEIEFVRAPFSVSSAACEIHTYGDVNLDGYVNRKNAVIVSRNYEVAGTPTWNPRADVNGDGMVDVPDVALVCPAFGSKA